MFLGKTDQNKTRSQLRNTKIGCLEHTPIGLVAHIMQPFYQISAVICELRRGKAGNILQKDRLRSHLIDQAECIGKHVPVIVNTKLLARDREGWAGHAGREKIHT